MYFGTRDFLRFADYGAFWALIWDACAEDVSPYRL